MKSDNGFHHRRYKELDKETMLIVFIPFHHDALEQRHKRTYLLVCGDITNNLLQTPISHSLHKSPSVAKEENSSVEPFA